MITEILNFTTSNKVEQIYLDKYHRHENIILNTNLHNKNVDDHINELNERFSTESDDLILLVVKYEPPTEKPPFPYNIDHEWWENYKEICKNIWGFKILNPKLF